METSYETMRAHLPDDIAAEVVVAPHLGGSRGRVENILHAARHQGDVNHITGDIHYVTYLLRKRRTVLTIHDIGFEEFRTGLAKHVLRWLWLTIPEKRVAVITTVSEFTRQQVLKTIRCPPAKVQVVPTVISPGFRRVDGTFNAARPTVLAIGTVVNKNLERLCEALTAVGRELPVRLLHIGKLTPAQEVMFAEARARGAFEFENRRNLTEEQLIAAYAESDVLAFVSWYEGFGMPILEAQTVGRVVVTSTAASMPEVAGDGAHLVDPFDVGAIRDGILRVVRDAPYREALIARGFRNRLRFTPESVAAKYAAIYRRLAGR
jgi:glycosyltransferase involved in cell wall biosynthesis